MKNRNKQLDIRALALTIRNAGCRIFRTPTFDDEAGELWYFAEAVREETGEIWQVYGDDEHGTLVELAEQVGIELMV